MYDRENVKPWKEKIKVHRSLTLDAAPSFSDESIDFVYVDARSALPTTAFISLSKLQDGSLVPRSSAQVEKISNDMTYAPGWNEMRKTRSAPEADVNWLCRHDYCGCMDDMAAYWPKVKEVFGSRLT